MQQITRNECQRVIVVAVEAIEWSYKQQQNDVISNEPHSLARSINVPLLQTQALTRTTTTTITITTTTSAATPHSKLYAINNNNKQQRRQALQRVKREEGTTIKKQLVNKEPIDRMQ
jgi:hypothetical protein